MTPKTSPKIADKTNIGVITWAFSDEVGKVLLTNFINILEPSSNELFVITGSFHENTIFNKKIHIINIKHIIKKEPTVIKVFRFILMQLRISINLIKISKNADIIFFFLSMSLTLPTIFTKLLRKKTILIITSSFQKCAETEKAYSKMLLGYGGIILSGITGFLERINFTLSDQIILYSENLVEEFKLRKYRKKILIAPRHFVNLDEFKMIKQLKDRGTLVGYIGRLSEEKGVLNFVKAIPGILKEGSEIKFLVGGYGQLRDEIERYLKKENLEDKVKFTGWIQHDDLPKYLNELKLIVIPSYTETGPLILFEAMACGTPAIATLVGSIPDLIEDGKTGFILENNSSECIAENVINALNYPNLDKIVKNARELVEKEFTYEAAVERYRKILEDI